MATRMYYCSAHHLSAAAWHHHVQMKNFLGVLALSGAGKCQPAFCPLYLLDADSGKLACAGLHVQSGNMFERVIRQYV